MKRWWRGLSLAILIYLVFVALLAVIIPERLAAPAPRSPLIIFCVAVVCAVWFAVGLRWRANRGALSAFAKPHRIILLATALFSALTLIGFARLATLKPESDLTTASLGVSALLLYSIGHLVVSLHPIAVRERSERGRAGSERTEAGPAVVRTPQPDAACEQSRPRARKGEIIALVALLVVAASAHLLANGLVLYAAPRTLLAHTFDHGIFAQAMEGIIREGAPVTTLERGRQMSHFAVHFSPVLYLVAPFYALARSQVFLNVFQLVPVFLAMWPLGAVMRLRGASPRLTLAVLTLYILSPAQIFSSHYGFHENVFLGLAIFTLWYFWERLRLHDSKPVMAGLILSTFFVLGVKEDAFIYVLAFAMWQIFEAARSEDRKTLTRAVTLAVVALVYFAVVTGLMAHFGEGTMQVSRFSNFLPEGESGFLAIIGTILAQPGYALAQVFATPKVSYLLIVMAAVAFAPVWSRRYATAWLLVPLVFVNLLSSWIYQFDLSFQYHYGSSALLLIILIVSAGALKNRKIVAAAVAFAIIFSGAYDWAHLREPVRRAWTTVQSQSATADQMNAALQELPKDRVYLVDSTMGAAMFQFPHTYLEPAKLPESFQDGGFVYMVMDGRFSLNPEAEQAVQDLISRFDMQKLEVDAPVDIYRVARE